MSSKKVLPLAAPRISGAKQLDICRLDLSGVSQVEIARRVGVQWNTVKRVLDRTRASLEVTEDLGPERGQAIGVYLESQRTAWEAVATAMARGRSPAGLLREINQARIDVLPGLRFIEPDDAFLELTRFKRLAVEVIASEAPELAPVLARRLKATQENDDD